MDQRRLHIAILFIIVFLSNVAAILIELFAMSGQLFEAVLKNPLSPTLETELTEIAAALTEAQLPWMLSILFTLHLLVPLIVILFKNRFSAWVVFGLGSLLTAFGTIHSLEHALSGEIYLLLLTLLTLTLPGIYGVVFAYRLARSSRTVNPRKEIQNI